MKQPLRADEITLRPVSLTDAFLIADRESFLYAAGLAQTLRP
ncbi:hypothetical protein SXCC_01232 [Gluconacetobacter sp. SXCC-1]|nr:hypothetical protein SXCC_01232 [Gluconacetobacter sp. SXCC-1]